MFKEIRTWASRHRLSEIFRFNIPRRTVSRALFPENAFSAWVDGCEGGGNLERREGGLRRRLFLWETNSRIRPMPTISGEASGGTEASKVQSDESRAQESRALWKRGIALRGLRVLRRGGGDSVLILQIKGKFEIPTTCSKRRAFHHLFSSPSRAPSSSLIEFCFLRPRLFPSLFHLFAISFSREIPFPLFSPKGI